MTDDEYIKAALKTFEKSMNRHARDMTDHFNEASRLFETNFYQTAYRTKKRKQADINDSYKYKISAETYPELLDALHAILNDEIGGALSQKRAAALRSAPKPQEPFESDPLWTPVQSDRKMTAAAQKTKISAAAAAEKKTKPAEGRQKQPPRSGMHIVI